MHGFTLIEAYNFTRDCKIAAEDFDLDVIVKYMCIEKDRVHGAGDHHAYMNGLSVEFKRFAVLMALEEVNTPSGPVLEFWRAFLLHPKLYMEFCEELCASGDVIDHNPQDMHDADRNERYAATIRVYKDLFDEDPPAVYWEKATKKRKQASRKSAPGIGGVRSPSMGGVRRGLSPSTPSPSTASPSSASPPSTSGTDSEASGVKPGC